MTDEKTEARKIRIQFKPTTTTPHADVQNGLAYRRRFVRKEQPFEVTEEDWETHVERTGLFEFVPEKKEPQGQQGQQGGQPPPQNSDAK